MNRLAVYPGSFDPLHNGHVDIVRRAANLFDEVVVALLNNRAKTPTFPLEDRVEMIRETFQGQDHIRVESFDGLLVSYAESCGAATIIRGLRAISDFEYEFQMALMNRRLSPEIETVFLMPRGKYIYISSRMLMEVAQLGGDISAFVPPPVLRRLEVVFPEK